MKTKKSYAFDDNYLDEDEIDLVKLVSSSADVANQYVIFEGSNSELYAINVAKVEELIVYDKKSILRNNSKESLIIGTTETRDHMTPLVYFDSWFGNEKGDESEYELIILCHFSEKYLGLIVKQVIDIINISPDMMYANAQNNNLTTFIAKIKPAKEEVLSVIFDTDKLLYDLYGDDKSLESDLHAHITSDKKILFADDSRLVTKMAHDSFEKIGVKYRIFHDGQELLDALKTIDPDDIGMFLLDIEMPRKTGLDVINALKKEDVYKNIPIVVHTNMANASIVDRLVSYNISKIISKVDFKTIESTIQEYM